MDAHIFRSLSIEFGPALSGRRIEKIYSPAKSYWTLVLGARGGKRLLLFHPAKKDALLLLTGTKPQNPMSAPAEAMWFRKRISGRWLGQWQADWPGLRIAWELSPVPPDAPDQSRFLVLDMHAGMRLAGELEPSFGSEPAWPPLERALHDPDVWKEFPQLSPALRRRLKSLPECDVANFYASLAKQPANPIYVAYKNGTPTALHAWPQGEGKADGVQAFGSALEAAAAYGEPKFFAGLAHGESAVDREAFKVRERRLRRGLERLEADRERLSRMTAQQSQAELLQAELYKHKSGPTPERITGRHPLHGEMTVELNTRMSVAENMERLFQQVAKGRRGLAVVEQRRAQLGAELRGQAEGRVQAPAEGTEAPESKIDDRPLLSKRLRGLAVLIFTTSDGFRVLRGKNQEAGHKLLSQAASPFDLWFHAAHRPGAHVVLKRDYPAQEVPERSMREAAALAGLASGYAGEAKADVFCALVKDVRKIKGAALGLVRVEEMRQTLRVDLDPELPEKLKLVLPL
ncbi:putative RNA-binding protein, snRNP like protein [Desulfocurvibacter africanus PCS]|uniref:Putative RNA-binding protein, snRNP like protein n=1 Tax=Desulfocurvibacter africanus PCS TaxID=1262666 RepID=M5Q1X8_DESAF|nr:NFACT RNA binding domain-containing protein [Desulfocurvibacter africanus]EMG37956.1 putative RNA-binding protein, snRNP like protein [Desulfocurvibacter africanus PCS]